MFIVHAFFHCGTETELLYNQEFDEAMNFAHETHQTFVNVVDHIFERFFHFQLSSVVVFVEFN